MDAGFLTISALFSAGVTLIVYVGLLILAFARLRRQRGPALLVICSLSLLIALRIGSTVLPILLTQTVGPRDMGFIYALVNLTSSLGHTAAIVMLVMAAFLWRNSGIYDAHFELVQTNDNRNPYHPPSKSS